MAFIDKKDPVVLNIRLTSKGRELLSQGKLNFSYYAIGDSEIDYEFNKNVTAVDNTYSAFNASILKPADKNPNIISFIPRNISGDPFNAISTIAPATYSVENSVDALGFFTNSGTTFITDSNHVKQPDAMVQVNLVTGGIQLVLQKAPTYGTSGAEPQVGDLLLIKWTHGHSTTGYTVGKYNNNAYPTPNLWYKITSVIGTLGSGALVVVDRNLPNFSTLSLPNSVKAGAMIYYNQISFSGSTIFNMTPTEYLDESVISFLQNSQCPTVVFPYWNMAIIFTEEIAGVQAGKLQYTQFKNRSFGGFVSYIQNQAPKYKKLGVIHYTNSSPANVYAEGFLLKTPTLQIPTIMWHQSPTIKLGVTLVATGDSKMITGTTTGTSLNTLYYDLADTNGFVVGKVFPELKIFVIEDQELLFAMSYKSNRNWTLPNYAIGS